MGEGYGFLRLECILPLGNSRILDYLNVCNFCFVHPIFRFWLLVVFGDQVTEVQKYYVIYVYILQGKMGKTEKKRKKNHATKVIKRRKYGMNETFVLSVERTKTESE